MKRLIFITLSILIANVALAETKVREIKTDSFSGLDISAIYKVTLVKSSDYKVILTYNEEIEKYLDVSTRGNVLYLAINHRNFYDRLKSFSKISNCILKAEIHMPNLEELEMSGSSSLYSDDIFEVDDFKGDISGVADIQKLTLIGSEVEFEVSGASDVNLEMEVKECKLDVSGSSDMFVRGEFAELEVSCSGASGVVLEGSARQAEYECSGASSIKAVKLRADYLETEISGASRVIANVVRKLIVDISGASKLEYYSEKNMETVVKSISRASSVEKL